MQLWKSGYKSGNHQVGGQIFLYPPDILPLSPVTPTLALAWW